MSTATSDCLPSVNAFVSDCYPSHTPELEETADKPGISQDRYSLQMASLVPQMRQTATNLAASSSLRGLRLTRRTRAGLAERKAQKA